MSRRSAAWIALLVLASAAGLALFLHERGPGAWWWGATREPAVALPPGVPVAAKQDDGPSLAGHSSAAGKPRADAQGPQAPGDPAGVFRGIVEDEAEKPVAGAEVFVWDSAARAPDAVSAADGTFELRRAGRDLTVRVRAAGLIGKETETNMGVVDVIHIVMVRSAPLRVRVRSLATGAPILDARVRAVRADDVGNVDTWRRIVHAADERRTDAEGLAVVQVPPGTAYARVQAEGFVPSASPILVVPEEGAEIEVRLARGGRMVVTAKSHLGGLLAGAEVRLVAGPEFLRNATTDAAGRAVFEDVPPVGAADAWTNPPTPVQAFVAARAAEHAPRAQECALPVVGMTSEVEVVMGPSRVLEGVVLDASGAPLASYSVRLHIRGAPWTEVDWATPEWTNLDDAGRFRLTDLPAGAVTVLVAPTGHADWEEFRLEIPETGPVPLATLRLRPALDASRTLVLRAEAADGTRLADVSVQVTIQGQGKSHSARTDAQGAVTFEHLPAVVVGVRIEAGSGGIAETAVDLTRADVRDLVVRMAEGSADVLVRRRDGRPAPMDVYVFRWNGRDDDGYVDGRLTLDAAGRGTLRGLPEREYGLASETTGMTLVAGPARFRPGARGLEWIAVSDAEAQDLHTTLALVDAATGSPIEALSVRALGALMEPCEALEGEVGRYLARRSSPAPTPSKWPCRASARRASRGWRWDT